MATRKTTKQKAAAKRVAKKDATTASKTRSGKTGTVTTAKGENASRAAATESGDIKKFGNFDTETQKAAAGAVQLQAGADSGLGQDLGAATSQRLSAVQSAVSERDKIVTSAAQDAKRADEAASQQVAEVMTDLRSAPKAPLDNAMRKPAAPQDVGIHPDVTSPTNLFAAEVPALPGTGVADPRDLAPGQDMSPSPPVSSSNILPQPDKPGTNFSKL